MSVELTVLGSGSGGNCAYFEAGETRLLVDVGFSGKQIRERLASIGKTPEMLTGILLTHEHSDHIKGIKVLAAKLGIPIYCNQWTLEAVKAQAQCQFDARIFQTGHSFKVGDVDVDSFSIPHDACDPVGFVVHTEGGKIGFLTDLGHVTRLVIDRVKDVRVLVLETNYDQKLLQEAKRPESIKQRIRSRHGHLSNDAAAEAMEAMVSDHLEHVLLAHLSRDCNSPELARRVVGERLRDIGGTHLNLISTQQDHPCATLPLAPAQVSCS
ncbi:MAG: putative metallo-hydrolase YycJ [Verrucomicrobia subdivision 3 bacterium]|nr:putative metallo-hydrolase YycJ [Limisphaerales bacterium]MCS1413891.1 putative metallo-hydrolase YycJ [Limisphaerales bacterium]